MGEYATYRGNTVKIGTCENMYYLRADQRHLVPDYDFVLDVERFRFPFPDEDDIKPGAFEDYSRGVKIPGWSMPETLSGDEHGSVQFTSQVGYVLSIPCPEQFGTPGMSVDVNGLRVGRNGFNGGPVVRQQAFRGGVLVTLVSCGACGCLHRLDTIADAAPVIEAFAAEAERQEWRRLMSDYDVENDRWSDGQTNYGFEFANSETHRTFLVEIAKRIAAGYLDATVDAVRARRAS